MHILLIHQAFAALDEAGGTRHIEMARSLIDRGHRVTVIASPVNYLTGKSRQQRMQWVDRQEVEPGLVILRTYTYRAFHRSFVHRVLSFISFMLSSFWAGLGVRGVDLVWGTSPPIFQGFTAWLLARLKRIPFLFEVRDLWPAFAIAVGVLRNPLLIRLSRWLERFLLSRADLVMVNSPGFIEHVQRAGARKVQLVPNGADPAMFDPAATGAEFRHKHHLEDRFLVLYAGAHGMSNDLGVVIEAASLLRNHPQAAFIFIGDGKEKATLQARAAQLNLNNVLFLPSIAKTEIPEAIAAADACIAILKPLELYKTTYPNKVFDYMAAGRPVILAIDGVIRKVVEDAGAGIAVRPGCPTDIAGAVQTLSADPIKARAMGAAGRKAIEISFNRRELSRLLIQVIEGMGSKNGREDTDR